MASGQKGFARHKAGAGSDVTGLRSGGQRNDQNQDEDEKKYAQGRNTAYRCSSIPVAGTSAEPNDGRAMASVVNAMAATAEVMTAAAKVPSSSPSTKASLG